jgi:hypothetical protein
MPIRNIPTADDLHSITWPDVQTYYPPGWENSGRTENPLLDRDYRPRAAFCAKGAVLLDKRWPGTDPHEHWRGAVEPSIRKKTASKKPAKK